MKPKAFLWSPDGALWYVRRKGTYTRILAPHGTEAFDAAYWAILNGRTAPRTSWAALVASYRASDRWLNLKPRTRHDYEHALDYLLDKNGAVDVTRARRVDVLAAMDANRHRTQFANRLAVVMSNLLEHAVDLGWRTDNPAKGIRSQVVPLDRRKPHLPWTDEAVAKWRALAHPLPRLIFELGVGTMQRPADWCRFTWADFDGRNLQITQGKTGVHLVLPCPPLLLAVLSQAILTAGVGTHWAPFGPILRKPDGNPMDYRALSAVMRIERERLDLVAYDLHALRYRGVMELAWAGCTDDEIASYSGHKSKAMIAKYAGAARQIMRARQAAEKRG